MKRFFSLLLACFITLNLCVIVKADGLTGTYTFFDSAYSPTLDKYVILAKDEGNSSYPAKLFVSEDGIHLKETLSVSKGATGANPRKKQLLVWWESQNVFAAQLGSELYISSDGENWEKPALNASTNTYTSIATDGDRLLIGAKNYIKVADNYDEPAEEIKITDINSYYVKSIAIKPNSDIFYGMDGASYTTYMFRVETPERTVIQTVPETGGEAISDTFYNPEIDRWVSVNRQTRYLLLDEKSTFTYITPKIDGGEFTEKIIGGGIGEKYTVLGTVNGSLYYAENSSIADTGTIWNKIEFPDSMTEPDSEIRGITKGSENYLLVISKNGYYILEETDNGIVAIDSQKINIESDTYRIESPNENSQIFDVNISATNYNGTIPDIQSIEMTEPDSNISSSWDGEKLSLEVQPNTEAVKTFQLIETEGRTETFDISFVKETSVGLDGFESAVLPGEGEDSLELPYTPYVIASDGEKMSRPASITVISAPEGVTYDESKGVVVITPESTGGTMVLRVTSDLNPDNYKDFNIDITPRVPTTVDLTVSDETFTIPDSSNKTITCSAIVKDQIDSVMTSEEVEWSLSGNTTGISIDDNGIIKIDSEAIKGELTVKASSVTNSSIYAEKTINLLWSDKRSTNEDLKLIEDSVTTEENLYFKTEGNYGTTFEWKSEDTDIISDEGVIYRDRKYDTSTRVNVTCKKNDAVSSKNITVNVLKAVNFASVGDFEDNNAEGLNGTIVQDNVHDGEYAFKPDGDFAFTINAEKDSMYVIEAYVKADSAVSLSTDTAGKLTSIDPNGEYERIVESYLYSKDIEAEEIKFSASGDWYIDDIRVYDITPEYKAVMEKITTAEYSKKSSDKTAAREAAEDFLDIPLRERLLDRIDDIKTSGSGSGGTGGSGGSGSGGTGGSGGGSFVPPSSGGNTTIPNASEVVDNDEKVYEYNLIFKDLSHHWAKDDIEFMANNGIVNGVDDETFNPEANITRAEFTKLIVKTMGLAEVEYANTYYDIMAEDWYSGFVQAASNEGYISGYDGLFRPNDYITREEIAKIIVSAYNSKMNKTLEIGGALYYSDIESISAWAYDYIVEASNEGFINGITETEFAPKQNATRAQAVVMLKRLFDKINA